MSIVLCSAKPCRSSYSHLSLSLSLCFSLSFSLPAPLYQFHCFVVVSIILFMKLPGFSRLLLPYHSPFLEMELTFRPSSIFTSCFSLLHPRVSSFSTVPGLFLACVLSISYFLCTYKLNVLPACFESDLISTMDKGALANFPSVPLSCRGSPSKKEVISWARLSRQQDCYFCSLQSLPFAKVHFCLFLRTTRVSIHSYFAS